jgi:hypothetical protein
LAAQPKPYDIEEREKDPDAGVSIEYEFDVTICSSSRAYKEGKKREKGIEVLPWVALEYVQVLE